MPKQPVSRKRKRPTKKQANAKLLREHRQYYDALFELQGGVCAICKRTPEEAYAKMLAKARRVGVKNPKPPRLNMDHDWVTMKVLGLLCSYCNKKKPDYVPPEWVANLSEYVTNPPFDRLTT